MIGVSIIVACLLGLSLGRNNLGNLFGTAVGTGMVRLRTAQILTCLFLFLGAFVSSAATTSSITQIGSLKAPTDILVVCTVAAVVLELLSYRGIPASIVQTMVGSLIGWNAYRVSDMPWTPIYQMVCAWWVAPVLAAVICGLMMMLMRYVLTRWPLSLFVRDLVLRWGLILVGISAAYTLGANNIGTITGPFLSVFSDFNSDVMTGLVCLAVGIGFWLADKKVIATIAARLFPLSPAEAFMAMFGTTVSMVCFSIDEVREMLQALHLPSFPLVPIPMSSVLIGAICGISLARGGYGLRFTVLGRIMLSWILVPVLAGVMSWGLLWGLGL